MLILIKKLKYGYVIFSSALIVVLYSIIFMKCAGEGDEREKILSKLHEKYYYLNLYEDVKYTGTEKCVSCHNAIGESYHHTGMGSSLYRPEADNEKENYDNDNIIYDEKTDLYYEAYKKDGNYFQREFRKDKDGNVIHSLEKKVDYVIGSGLNTRSYLYQDNGFFYEMPMSWYTDKSKWDLSPGYQRLNLRFRREINQECMNCHNSYSGFTEFSENKFQMPIPEGISCERCHGPGELHVRRFTEKNNFFEAIESDTTDRTIVNPADLPLEEKLSVCFQCHLQGDVRVFTDGKKQSDFRPGMKLSEVKTVFVQDDVSEGDFKIASHAARMFLSSCFKNSDGGMTCLTCHDPHVTVGNSSKEFFNDKCLGCHQQNTLSPSKINVEHEEGSNCINCHMRQGNTSDILHVNFTDHWIRKRTGMGTDKITGDEILSKDKNIIPITLKSFEFTDNYKNNNSGLDLGIAYVIYFETKHPHQDYLKRALPLLEAGVKINPENLSAQYFLGSAYYLDNNFPEAIKTLEKLVATDTGNADAFIRLGAAYEKSGDSQRAIEYYEIALNIFPENVKVLNNLGNLYYSEGKINEAVETYKRGIKIIKDNPNILTNLGDISLYKLKDPEAAFNYLNKALEYDPDKKETLNNLGNAYLITGDKSEAEKIFKRVLKLEPYNAQALGNLAVIYEDNGNKNEAVKMLMKILEKDPNDKRAKDMLSKLRVK